MDTDDVHKKYDFIKLKSVQLKINKFDPYLPPPPTQWNTDT
jgi:hypothetical protein